MKNKIKTKAPNIDIKLPKKEKMKSSKGKAKASKKQIIKKERQPRKAQLMNIAVERKGLGEGQGGLGCCEFRLLSSTAIGLRLKQQALLLTVVEAGSLRSGYEHGPSGENPLPSLQMVVFLTRQRG